MIASTECVIVMVTVPDIECGRRLAGAALIAHLVACANLVPGLESHYWWQGRLESANEVLLLLKTTRPRLEELQDCLRNLHPYEVPEFVVLPITEGSAPYLDWLLRSVNPAPRPTSQA